ncbi:GntR family transcriptional regulator [Salicibibacter cibarius]|uniref:GntR family transcriptional regulator n=1 Tax=Salicibibacter cibarius TaxID=2743000 RepID=A0A7T6Z522_9BACI|nr:GntR family transcriptional regulator [Salicibibacter cibarius]QQK76957.1 GntR family transcriptional regulator [Salicibibacter cibarius]
MWQSLDDHQPVFMQIREMIENEIVEGGIKEGEQAPSTNQLVDYYTINPSTVLKGINQLVDAGILYKKRGVGMFVAEGARDQLLQARKEVFKEEYVWRMMREAKRIGISNEEVQEIVRSMKGRDDL